MAHLTLRVSEAEKARLVTAALRSEQSLSQYLRSVLLDPSDAHAAALAAERQHMRETATAQAIADLDKRLSALEERASREY